MLATLEWEGALVLRRARRDFIQPSRLAGFLESPQRLSSRTLGSVRFFISAFGGAELLAEIADHIIGTRLERLDLLDQLLVTQGGGRIETNLDVTGRRLHVLVEILALRLLMVLLLFLLVYDEWGSF